jgi:hypothetical protein
VACIETCIEAMSICFADNSVFFDEIGEGEEGPACLGLESCYGLWVAIIVSGKAI